jgi:hypothetical protein
MPAMTYEGVFEMASSEIRGKKKEEKVTYKKKDRRKDGLWLKNFLQMSD